MLESSSQNLQKMYGAPSHRETRGQTGSSQDNEGTNIRFEWITLMFNSVFQDCCKIEVDTFARFVQFTTCTFVFESTIFNWIVSNLRQMLLVDAQNPGLVCQ